MVDEIKKLNVSSEQAQARAPISGTAGPTTLDNDQFADVRDQLVARYELLPDELKSLITDDNFRTKLFEIAKEQKMTFEQLGILEIEVSMVILGMTPPRDFRDELQLQLKKNDVEIDALVAKVNAEVFTPIRASLEKLYADHKNPEDYMEGKEEVIPTPAIPTTSAQTAQAPIGTTQPKIEMARATNLSEVEKNVLGKAGVVLSETPTQPAKMPQAPMSSRTNILAGIENPSSLRNIVAEKLNSSSPVIPTSKSTDYSIPKTTPSSPSVPSTPKADPYREPIG